MMIGKNTNEVKKDVTLSTGCAAWLENMAKKYDVDVNEIVFRLQTMVEEEAVDLEEYSW